jgi:predicted DNA-binding WGR domain protein
MLISSYLTDQERVKTMSLKKTSLYYREGSSDKEYHISVEPRGNLWVVSIQYGRRGSKLQTGTKTNSPVSETVALEIFEKLKKEKQSKGYTEHCDSLPYEKTDKEHKSDLNLSGLTSLSDSAAESLSKHKGDLNLSGLTSVSDSAAESLGKHKGNLILNSLITLSDSASEFLLKSEEEVDIDYEDSEIDDTNDNEYNEYNEYNETEDLNELEIKLVNVDEESLIPNAEKILTKKLVQKAIASQGLDDTFLEQFTSIEDDAAFLLGKRDAYLPLNRIQNLSVQSAKYLAKTHSHLCLDGLSALSPELLDALVERPVRSSSLSLNGITTIGIDEARKLAKVASYRVELGLTTLTATVAEELGKRKGHLSLERLESITDDAAVGLSKVRGFLDLNGIRNLSDIAAQNLSKHLEPGKLSLQGITSLSQAACVSISKVIDDSGFSTNPMRPGRPFQEYRNEKEIARNQLFFRHLFADRVSKRSEKIRKYLISSTGETAIKTYEANIGLDPQDKKLSYIKGCLSLSVSSVVRLSNRKDSISCPGFLGFHDADENGHDWKAVGDAVVRYLEKIRGIGPRCATLGGLLIELMLASGKIQALGQLLRVARQIKLTETKEWIEIRVAWKAQEIGVSTQAIEDTTIDTRGFGNYSQPDLTRESVKLIEVGGLGSVEISVPSGESECYLLGESSSEPIDLKTLRKTNKEAADFLTAECKAIDGTLRDCKKRLESSWCSPETWTWEDLKQCWFKHPLVNPLVKRLIWRFYSPEGEQDGLWDGESGFTDSSGKWLGDIAAETRVRLWHPAHSPATVEAWRRRILEQEINQPFRQAFREVYLLTDAEKAAKDESARFAGHILKQNQFAALCRERGWSVSLAGPFDSYSGAEKLFREHKLVVRWGGDPVGSETSGVFYSYIRMGVVNFSIPFAGIPPIVFSEVIRDLDLFVSVSSIGVDPSFNVAGATPEILEYWNRFTGSDLSESGKVRREAIQNLLPSLPNAKQMTLEKNHLVVRGTIAAYCIHLQSGAVFKKESYQHVCIVAKASPSDKSLTMLVGDPMLSLIVSKALLLANDDKIKDKSILNQIS